MSLSPSMGGLPAYAHDDAAPTVEEILEKGLLISKASPTHIAIRGSV